MAALLIRLFIKDRDNVKDKNVRKKYGYLGSCTGIILNIMLFLGKLIAGFVSGAVSVMADAFNSLSDAGSSIMSLVGFKMAAKASQPQSRQVSQRSLPRKQAYRGQRSLKKKIFQAQCSSSL